MCLSNRPADYQVPAGYVLTEEEMEREAKAKLNEKQALEVCLCFTFIKNNKRLTRLSRCRFRLYEGLDLPIRFTGHILSSFRKIPLEHLCVRYECIKKITE